MVSRQPGMDGQHHLRRVRKILRKHVFRQIAAVRNSRVLVPSRHSQVCLWVFFVLIFLIFSWKLRCKGWGNAGGDALLVGKNTLHLLIPIHGCESSFYPGSFLVRTMSGTYFVKGLTKWQLFANVTTERKRSFL